MVKRVSFFHKPLIYIISVAKFFEWKVSSNTRRQEYEFGRSFAFDEVVQEKKVLLRLKINRGYTT